ncbi:glutathione S-transferase family protein [Nocardia farcinica]|uniref:glutathione S-transferase family protein n=1 Tax=Nocardia farcinica TaxID=37329 RepID=UPI0018959AE8|nr:glutathione binding-like protein [Nocardia farcinica]MBF6071705.1 glutathione S-transferase N-terminal domain-containing protein [Nocardia farcinica]
MIDLYYDLTPNGRKVHLALEELGLAYTVQWIDVKKGQQFTPYFSAINPNNKIPAIVDHDGPDGHRIRLFESGAILMYLAEKTGRLLPADASERWEATCWVFWQVANQGPGAGNAAHFVQYAPAAGIIDEYATARYVTEVERCCGVLDRRLAGREFLVGDELTVADIACFPWTRVLRGQNVDIARYPNLAAWSNRIAGRPSAKAKVPPPAHDTSPPTELDPAGFAGLFGVDPRTIAAATSADFPKADQ